MRRIRQWLKINDIDETQIDVAPSVSSPPSDLLVFDDFISNDFKSLYNWVQGGGSGTFDSKNGEINAPGILSLKPPSVTTNYSNLNLYPGNAGNFGITPGNQGDVTYQFHFRSHYVMSGGVIHKIGAFPSAPNGTVVPLNGMYFSNNPFSNWMAITGNGSTTTQTDTGLSADTNWHIFKMVVNAAATEIKFYIDGALITTHTTNLPTSPLTFTF